MMACNTSLNIVRCAHDIIYSILCRDVFHNNLQFRHILHQWLNDLLNAENDEKKEDDNEKEFRYTFG